MRVAEPVISTRELYGSAARSTIHYVDTLYTEAVAAERQLDMESAREWVKRKDPVYLATVGALDQQGNLFNLFEDEYAGALAQVGALMGAVAGSSLLVAQHYSLGEVTDDLGRVVDFRARRALEHMMGYADGIAMAVLLEADAVTKGAATQMLLLGVDGARRNREVSVVGRDKLTALSLYWTTTLNARLMIRLARAQ